MRCCVIDSRQEHRPLETRLQAVSPVVMEMQIPAVLGCQPESSGASKVYWKNVTSAQRERATIGYQKISVTERSSNEVNMSAPFSLAHMHTEC